MVQHVKRCAFALLLALLMPFAAIAEHGTDGGNSSSGAEGPKAEDPAKKTDEPPKTGDEKKPDAIKTAFEKDKDQTAALAALEDPKGKDSSLPTPTEKQLDEIEKTLKGLLSAKELGEDDVKRVEKLQERIQEIRQQNAWNNVINRDPGDGKKTPWSETALGKGLSALADAVMPSKSGVTSGDGTKGARGPDGPAGPAGPAGHSGGEGAKGPSGGVMNDVVKPISEAIGPTLQALAPIANAINPGLGAAVNMLGSLGSLFSSSSTPTPAATPRSAAPSAADIAGLVGGGAAGPFGAIGSAAAAAATPAATTPSAPSAPPPAATASEPATPAPVADAASTPAASPSPSIPATVSSAPTHASGSSFDPNSPSFVGPPEPPRSTTPTTETASAPPAATTTPQSPFSAPTPAAAPTAATPSPSVPTDSKLTSLPTDPNTPPSSNPTTPAKPRGVTDANAVAASATNGFGHDGVSGPTSENDPREYTVPISTAPSTSRAVTPLASNPPTPPAPTKQDDFFATPPATTATPTTSAATASSSPVPGRVGSDSNPSEVLADKSVYRGVRTTTGATNTTSTPTTVATTAPITTSSPTPSFTNPFASTPAFEPPTPTASTSSASIGGGANLGAVGNVGGNGNLDTPAASPILDLARASTPYSPSATTPTADRALASVPSLELTKPTSTPGMSPFVQAADENKADSKLLLAMNNPSTYNPPTAAKVAAAPVESKTTAAKEEVVTKAAIGFAQLDEAIDNVGKALPIPRAAASPKSDLGMFATSASEAARKTSSTDGRGISKSMKAALKSTRSLR